MEDWSLLTQWVIEKIKTEYPEDIDLLLAVKGHCTGGDGHGECFDYFIPATARGNALSQTMIIHGVGHDLYPRDWERVARSADLDEMAIVLAGATILYARTPAAADRFRALQARQQANLHSDAYLYGKALARLEAAMAVYSTLQFEEKRARARAEAACILQYLSEAVAFLNHSFADAPLFSERQAYDPDPAARIYACPDLVEVPEGFFADARALLSAPGIPENRRIAHRLLTAARRFLQEKAPAAAETDRPGPDFTALGDWYQEMSLTWRRLRWFCEQNQAEKAFKEAYYLQSEFSVIAPEFGISEFDLLDGFDPADLGRVALRGDAIEARIRALLAEHGVSVREYDTLADFLADN